MTALRGHRVVFVVAGEVLGGAERGALDLAEMLREEGASVAVLALDDRPGRGREVAAERRLRWVTEPVPWVGGRLHKSASLVRVTRALRALRPDAIVASTNLPNVVCGLTWRATGAKTAVWRQCDVNGTTRFGARLFRHALHATPLVVTSAAHARTWLAMSYGLAPTRARVIPSVVHLEPAHESGPAWRARLDLSRDALVCCMLAHLHAGKDHATLLRAWRLVARRARRSSPDAPSRGPRRRDRGRRQGTRLRPGSRRSRSLSRRGGRRRRASRRLRSRGLLLARRAASARRHRADERRSAGRGDGPSRHPRGARKRGSDHPRPDGRPSGACEGDPAVRGRPGAETTDGSRECGDHPRSRRRVRRSAGVGGAPLGRAAGRLA